MPRASRYFLFFAIQTIGAAILFWYSVPLYQQTLADPGAHEVRTDRLVWSIASITLMQVGYWMRHRFKPPMPQARNAFVAHVILFCGRLSFVFGGAVFGFAFLIRKPDFQIPSLVTSF